MGSMVAPSRRDENAAATRQALVETATELFAERGYAAVSTADVVARARVTRGALYHHFKDKPGLMRAVLEQAEHELLRSVTGAARQSDDARADLQQTLHAFLEAISDPVTRAIVFVEAPAALGWSEWRDIDAGRSLNHVVGLLQRLREEGHLGDERHLPALGHLIMGAINEAAMFVAASRQPRKARVAAEAELARLLDALLA